MLFVLSIIFWRREKNVEGLKACMTGRLVVTLLYWIYSYVIDTLAKAC